MNGKSVPDMVNPERRNKLSLGLFAFNGPGTAFTLHPDQRVRSWDDNVRIAQLADNLGIEALVPFARWLPFGGDGNPSGRILDPIAWAAGLGAVTKRICVFSTIHVSAYNPVAVAKTAATIDQMTGGRYGINIVVGWNKAEVELFGEEIKEHDTRYDVADEWLDVLEKLWTAEKRFDYPGKYYNLQGAVSDPRPVQQRPIIINAGGSARGREFAADRCDIAFLTLADTRPEAIKAQVDGYRRRSLETGRDVQVWSFGHVVQRPTVAEAQAYVDEYAGKMGNIEAARGFVAGTIAQSQYATPELMAAMEMPLMAGGMGYPLYGNEQDIARSLELLSELGIDGLLLSWLDYEGGLRQFGETVLPLLEDAGLRKKVAA